MLDEQAVAYKKAVNEYRALAEEARAARSAKKSSISLVDALPRRQVTNIFTQLRKVGQVSAHHCRLNVVRLIKHHALCYSCVPVHSFHLGWLDTGNKFLMRSYFTKILIVTRKIQNWVLPTPHGTDMQFCKDAYEFWFKASEALTSGICAYSLEIIPYWSVVCILTRLSRNLPRNITHEEFLETNAICSVWKMNWVVTVTLLFIRLFLSALVVLLLPRLICFKCLGMLQILSFIQFCQLMT